MYRISDKLISDKNFNKDENLFINHSKILLDKILLNNIHSKKTKKMLAEIEGQWNFR